MSAARSSAALSLTVALLVPWLLALPGAAALAAPEGDAAERARIAAERQAVEARYEAARRDCETRFVVNNCLEAARQARREALAPLQRQTHLLDDARRRERAVERLRAIQARESAAAAMPALQGASAAAAPPAAAASADAAAASRPLLQRALRPAAAASAAEQAARQRQAQHQRRLQAAQAHQEAVQARNARRDAQRKPAEGLPVPVPGAPTP